MDHTVWSEFQYKNQDGIIFKFTVQDCPEDRINDVIDLYKKYFMKDESLQKMSGISKSKEAREECSILFAEMLKGKDMNIAICIDNSTNAVVGVSSMELSKSTYEIPDVRLKTKETVKLFEILDGMGKIFSVPRSFCVDKFYDGRGIIVHRDYRGYGIGSVLVRTRKNICKGHGVSLTSAWMTSIGTQKAAERDGWETPFEIDSHEFARKFDVTPYDGIAPTFKVMVKRVS